MSSSGAPAAIVVDGLAKRFTLGERGRHRTLRDALTLGVRRGLGLASPAKVETLWALEDVSFEVPRGAVLGVIGRNGAGKSTLLKVLSRITAPTRGRVELVGRVGSMLEVGTGFHPELTGRENIFLNGAVLGMKRVEIAAKFDEIVDFAEVAAFLDTPVKRYSSGMYVRLAFSVAAHLEPEILLVDEVLAVGDAAFQKKCLGRMGTAAGEGRTVLFVSHNMAAVQELTTTGLWLEGGRIAGQGPTGEVVQRYLSSFQDSAGTVRDVADAPRPFPQLSRAIELQRVELAGVETPLLAADRELALCLTVRCREAVPELRFGVTVARIDGVAVGTLFSPAQAGLRPGDQARFRVALAEPRLAPGTYTCAVSVGTGDGQTRRREFDVVRDAMQFQVLAGREDDADGVAGEWHASWGVVRFPDPAIERLA
ncbi:MAG: ABC transporter ATP-binding protein [Planctomycetota bacterium]